MQRGIGEPLVANRNRIPLLGDVAPLFKKAARTVACIDRKPRRAARTRKLLQRVCQHRANALPRSSGMDIKHVDPVLAFERGEADRRALKCCNQGQLPRKLATKFSDIVGRRRPGLLLRFGIIVTRQFFYAVAENFTQQRRVRWQERAQCEHGMRYCHHRATFHCVLPSLVSSSSMPIALSSSRIRSASLKFFAFRALLRASIRLTTLFSSTAADAGRKLAH